jgi:hypothetical protein
MAPKSNQLLSRLLNRIMLRINAVTSIKAAKALIPAAVIEAATQIKVIAANK